MNRASLLVIACLLLTAPPAAAASLGYSGTSTTCYLFVAAAAVPQALLGCSVSHAGALTVTAGECTATGCNVVATGSATGASSVPALLEVSSRLSVGNAVAFLCITAPTALLTSLSCSGSATIFVPAEAGGPCVGFTVFSHLRVDNAGNLANLQAWLGPGFRVCRDASGAPSIEAGVA